MGSRVVDADDSGAAVTALPIAVAGDLPLEKRGEFRVASGTVILNVGKIKMKSTDESEIERTLRGNITEVAKPQLSAAEVSEGWDSLSKMEESCWNETLLFLWKSSSGQAQSLESSWQEHQTLPRRELVRVCASWRCHAGTFTGRALSRMKVDDGHRDEQDESADQPEELRRVLAARQPTELDRQKHSQRNHAVFAPWCEVCVKAKGTGAQHRRQTNKELAKQEQYGPRIYSDFFYMCEGGVSTPMLALKFSRSCRMDCHSVGAERLDAVRSEVLCRLHSANWTRVTENQPSMPSWPQKGWRAFHKNRHWETTKQTVTSNRQ